MELSFQDQILGGLHWLIASALDVSRSAFWMQCFSCHQLALEKSWVTWCPLCFMQLLLMLKNWSEPSVVQSLCSKYGYHGPWSEEFRRPFHSLCVPNADVTMFKNVWLKLCNVNNCSFLLVGITFTLRRARILSTFTAPEQQPPLWYRQPGHGHI